MRMKIMFKSNLSLLFEYLKEQYEAVKKCGLCHILSSGAEMTRGDLFLPVGQLLLG